MYLVIETHIDEQSFTHFIDLNNSDIEKGIAYFVYHLYSFPNQIVDKVYFSQNRLTNW